MTEVFYMLVKSLFTEEERRQLAEECCRPLRTLTKEEIRRSEENKEQAIKANIERLKELNPESMHRLKRFNKDTNQFEICYNEHKTNRGIKSYFLEESTEISDIENYDLAAKDDFQDWIIHHKLETRGFGYLSEELKALGLYYNRPSSELIYLKQKDHAQIHADYKIEARKIRERLTDCLY